MTLENFVVDFRFFSCQNHLILNNAAPLLRAIVSLDGEALVLHPGDKPYIVAPSGQIELSSKPLSERALGVLLSELLPALSQATLHTTGSVQWELPPSPDVPEGRFIVVAARVSGDHWVEVRRYGVRKAGQLRGLNRSRTADDDLRIPSAEELWPGKPDEYLDEHRSH